MCTILQHYNSIKFNLTQIFSGSSNFFVFTIAAYWVKFFKSAGFPLDVATKHAVVFSNNRIKPDMLPDLDKPSLKDMGITLMGDMIAILRYAKKVVEETTCERFLVDTEDEKTPVSRQQQSGVARTIVKKAIAKAPSKTALPAKPKVVQEVVVKAAKTPASTVTKSSVVKKKILPSTRVVSQVVKEPSQVPVKRKLVQAKVEESESESEEDEWVAASPPKRLKLPVEDEKIGYTIVMPKGRTVRSQEIIKKLTDQKRTVFDRLGDSSVTSTTNLAESSPTFNITGLGSEVLKRNSSVFNRLGDKDAKKTVERVQSGILKNGVASNAAPTPQGILKNRPSTIGSTTITVKNLPTKATTKSTGTMHADHEKSQKSVSCSVKQLVRTTKKIRLNDSTSFTPKTMRKVAITSSKLGGYCY